MSRSGLDGIAARNPSFVAAPLILPFGLRAMTAAALALIAVAAAVSYAGIGLWNFSIALVLLGIG